MSLTETSGADDDSSVVEEHVGGGGDDGRSGASQSARVGTKVAAEGEVTDRIHLPSTRGALFQLNDFSEVVPETPVEADEEDDSPMYSARHLAAAVSVQHEVDDVHEGHLAAVGASVCGPGDWNAREAAVYDFPQGNDAMVGGPCVLRAATAGDLNVGEGGVKRARWKFSEYYPTKNRLAETPPAIPAQPSQALPSPDKSQRWHGDDLWSKSRRTKADRFTAHSTGLPDQNSSPRPKPSDGLGERKSFGAKVLQVILGWKQARNRRVDSETGRSTCSETPLKSPTNSCGGRKVVSGRIGVAEGGSDIDRGLAADAYAILGKAWRGGMGNGTEEGVWDGVDGGDGEEGVWGMAKMYLRDQPPAGPLEPIMEEEAEEVDPMAWVRLQMAEFGDQKSPPRSLLMGAAAPGGRNGVAEVLSSDKNVVCAVDSFAWEAKVGGGMLAHRRRRSTGSIMSESSESEMESLRQEAMQATEAHACAKKDAHNSMQACLRSLSDVAASLDEAERQYSETAQEVHASYQQLQKDMRAVDSAVQQAAADKPWGEWVRAKSSTQPRGGTEMAKPNRVQYSGVRN